MTEEEKIEQLVSPEKFFPADTQVGNLRGNRNFIDAVARYHAVLSESQFWRQGLIQEVQLIRLKNLLRRVASGSNFWRERLKIHGISIDDIVSIGDLSKFPVLYRDKLLEIGNKIYVNPLPEDMPVYSRFTGGTTGTQFKLSFGEREMLIANITFFLRHPAFEKISLYDFLSRKPFVVFGIPGSRYAFQKDFHNYEFPDLKSFDLYDQSVRAKIYKSINNTSPAYLTGFGSLLSVFARVVAEDKISLPLLAVHTTSEFLSPGEREFIQKTLQIPLVNMFCSNGPVIGFECPASPNRYHVNSEKVILEVVGEDGVALRDGEEGELVVTALSYCITPIIRYAISDIGKISRDSCGCGRNLPTFESSGRRGYDVVLPSGKKIRIVHLYNALMRQGLGYKSKQLQVVQDRLDNLTIFIIPTNRLDIAEEINIRLALTRLFEGEKINIEIKYVKNILPGKGNKPQFFIPLQD